MHRLVATHQKGATQTIARGIDRALATNMKMLWLLSGGSNIKVELAVLNRLEHATPQNLTISLVDERLVPQDSVDSNWYKLLTAGLTNEKARLMPIVTNASLDAQTAAEEFENRLNDALQGVDVVISQFGIGSDGHTAGILPHSVAAQEQKRLVVGYKGSDFERVTITPAFFNQVDLAIAVVMGKSKRRIIEQLASEIPAEEQPAQLLKLAKELIIYTDQVWSQ